MKRCFGNIQQVYRKTPTANCDFNKAAKQHIEHRISSTAFTVLEILIPNLTHKFICFTYLREFIVFVLVWNHVIRKYLNWKLTLSTWLNITPPQVLSWLLCEIFWNSFFSDPSVPLFLLNLTLSWRRPLSYRNQYHTTDFLALFMKFLNVSDCPAMTKGKPTFYFMIKYF